MKNQAELFSIPPLVKEEEILKQETDCFLNRFYDGWFSSLVTNFLEEDRLTAREIHELKEILDAGLGREDE